MEDESERVRREPAKETPIAAVTEVLVVGGGPAGVAAAVSAARSGARVMLAERYGFLGGMATAALVGPLMSYYTEGKSAEVPGQPEVAPEKVIGGVLDELVDRMVAVGGAVPPSLAMGHMVLIDAEAFKTVALRMVLESGVKPLLHSLGVDVLREGNRVDGVVFETKSGRLAVLAEVIVDATGDADIAARAGAPFDVGREGDCLCQPMSLMFKMGGVDLEQFGEYVRQHPEEFGLAQGLKSLVEEATQRGDLTLPREDILFFPTPIPGEVVVNSTRMTRLSGTNVWDLTEAEIEGHQQVEMLVRFFRRYVPGFERSHLIQTGVQVGVRETRRVLGEYVLTAEDVLSGAHFEDVVARGCYPLDVHNPEGPGTIMKRLAPGVAYDIPYRCLVPREVEGLLIAGRCISGTHEAQSSYRVIPICLATGQAAGVAAAHSVRWQVSPRWLEVDGVQRALLRQAANLGPDTMERLKAVTAQASSQAMAGKVER